MYDIFRTMESRVYILTSYEVTGLFVKTLWNGHSVFSPLERCIYSQDESNQNYLLYILLFYSFSFPRCPNNFFFFFLLLLHSRSNPMGVTVATWYSSSVLASKCCDSTKGFRNFTTGFRSSSVHSLKTMSLAIRPDVSGDAVSEDFGLGLNSGPVMKLGSHSNDEWIWRTFQFPRSTVWAWSTHRPCGPEQYCPVQGRPCASILSGRQHRCRTRLCVISGDPPIQLLAWRTESLAQ